LLRSLGAVFTVTIVALAAAVSLAVRNETPVVDQFYAAPREVPREPGVLIRSAPFTRDVPNDALGWRILYTTRRGDGAPAVASAIVVVPKTGAGDWPVINWDHGTTGYAQICAPSLLPHPFDVGALFVLPQIIERGWALVATDYIGLGTVGPHPYLVGKDSAYATLDALRAAQTLKPARLGRDSVVWGHSQGGAAALWTGALAKKYAPELKIEGVAALAPAANLPGLTGNLSEFIGGSVFASFVAAAYSATYSDVTWNEYIRPGAEPVVRAMSERCLTGAGLYVSVLDALSLTRDPEIFGESPTTGPLGRRLEQNIPPATITVPLLIAQGRDDPIVLPSVQQSYIDRVRSAGEHVDYRTFAGEDHVGLVKPDSPLIPVLFRWTASRFASPTR
jgi:pimeloyl-ACP methyl ester carboxylesterase